MGHYKMNWRIVQVLVKLVAFKRREGVDEHIGLCGWQMNGQMALDD